MATNNATNNYVGPITAGFTYFIAANAAVGIDTWTDVLYGAVPFSDIDGHFNNGTGVYTVQSDGLYYSNISVNVNAAAGYIGARFIVNRGGSDIFAAMYSMKIEVAAYNRDLVLFNTSMLLEAGDLVRSQIISYTDAATLAASANNYWTLSKVGYY